MDSPKENKVLDVRSIQVAYGRVIAVRDMSFSVDPGALVALVGANGAGKTTTLKAVLGLVPKSAGHIFFNGTDITNLPPWRIAEMGVGFVPEGARVFPDLTVRENLLVGGYKVQKHLLKQRMNDVWELFPVLRERLNQRAGTLSGGERQMLAIARALMSNPQLLLIDEVSMGLMPILVAQVFSTLVELNKKGVTILMAEQNVQEALSIASFAYVIENGRVVLSGQPDQLLANEHVRVAYLGL